MVTKNIFLGIAFFINFSSFASCVKSNTIDYKKYNLTEEDVEQLENFNIMQKEKNNFYIAKPNDFFSPKENRELYNMPSTLTFNWELFKELRWESPKIQNFVQEMYISEFWNNADVQILLKESIERAQEQNKDDVNTDNSKKLLYVLYKQLTTDFDLYAPQANQFNNVVQNPENVAGYAAVLGLITMFCGVFLTLFTSDNEYFEKGLLGASITQFIYLAYGFAIQR